MVFAVDVESRPLAVTVSSLSVVVFFTPPSPTVRDSSCTVVFDAPPVTSVVVVVVRWSNGVFFSIALSCLSISTALPIGSGDAARAMMSFIALASVAGLAADSMSLPTWSSWRCTWDSALSTSAFCASIAALAGPLRLGISSSSLSRAPASLS